MRRTLRHPSLPILGAVLALTFLSLGCPGPKYPNCKKDKHCTERGEYCVKGMCVECRNSKDCPAGERCKSGRCELPEGACTSTSDCPSGERCKDGRCKPECSSSDECPAGHDCESGRCVPKAECAEDSECPPGSSCVDGRCKATSSTGPDTDCSLENIYFALDSDALTPAALETLRNNAECANLTENRDKAITVEGHCDPRGTDEYNLALSDRRASAVKEYLGRLGVDGTRINTFPKGEEEASGRDEDSWKEDRKAVVRWR